MEFWTLPLSFMKTDKEASAASEASLTELRLLSQPKLNYNSTQKLGLT